MNDFILIMQKTLLYTAPLLIVALAGCFAEKSGVLNLALEGGMIFGSFIGAIFVYFIQKVHAMDNMQQLMFLIALLISGFAGAVFSMLLSLASVKFKSDQTIIGTAMNMLAPALLLSICFTFANQNKLVMDPMPNYVIITNVDNILAIFCNKIYISTYICIGLFIIFSIVLYKTKLGTHLRACGENPQAADSLGINVYHMRYLGVTVSGFLSGLGGYAYIAAVSAGTAESTIGGMGFLALAIMIFGNWNPLGIALGAFLFGLLKCLGPISGSVEFLKNLNLPIYFYNIVPYVIVILVLVISRKRNGCPKAVGVPFEKDLR